MMMPAIVVRGLYGSVENGCTGHVPHVIAADLTGTVGKPVGNMLEWLLSNSRGLSSELPATATTRAFCFCILPSPST